MKKQIKKTGFHEMCILITQNELTLENYKNLVEVVDGTIYRDRFFPIIIGDKFTYPEAISQGWLIDDKTPSDKLKKLIAEINGLFKPVKKNDIKIPEEMVIYYNELFPDKIIPTSKKHARCNIIELTKSFQWFVNEYGYQWDVILKATILYVVEKEADNFNYMRTSKYFIRKMDNNRVWSSDLADYCMRIVSGAQPEGKFVFPEKVV